ncbi:MAG: hypothetical protein FWE68_06325, partial [Defluviitaleaceae bacterium]|nr:hypothetical protein [Defluviitaleaceae bacterium]
YYGFNTRGALLWQYNAPRELRQLIYINGTDTVLEVGFTETRILRRERLSAPVELYEPPLPPERPSPEPMPTLPPGGVTPPEEEDAEPAQDEPAEPDEA